MKVNISYAVDLEDVPSEVAKLISTCEDLMRAIHGDMDSLVYHNPTHMLKQISQIREKISNVDLRLDDCARIMAGFLDIETKLAIPNAKAQQDGDENEGV